MKRVTCWWLGAALLAGVAGAQTIGPGVNATIPFEFKAGNKIMQAGQYTLRTPTGGVLQISPVTGGDSAILLGGATNGEARHEDGALIFNRYGDQYFLSKVLTARGTGVMVSPSRLEREHLAIGKAQSTTVVASRSR